MLVARLGFAGDVPKDDPAPPPQDPAGDALSCETLQNEVIRSCAALLESPIYIAWWKQPAMVRKQWAEHNRGLVCPPPLSNTTDAPPLSPACQVFTALWLTANADVHTSDEGRRMVASPAFHTAEKSQQEYDKACSQEPLRRADIPAPNTDPLLSAVCGLAAFDHM